MERKTFRIGEIAHELGVESFVVRFWEKQFGIRPHRSEGGQRYYTSYEMNKFLLIKELLYQKKFTIAGAKEHLDMHALKKTPNPLREFSPKQAQPSHTSFHSQISLLKKQLKRLKEILLLYQEAR